uniref:VOC family protein n=1 Tax=Globicatella sulfidifaciens TaxID=136093 RepID=UPI0023F335F5|nr:VOC family protein [Globicatella sulfidifaciens]
MINSIGQVMLYVEDIEKAAEFWRDQVGFERIEKQVQGPQTFYIIAPKLDSEVQFVLHDKAEVVKMNPRMNLGIPSILFTTDDLQGTYQHFIANGIQANPPMDLGLFKVFNFADHEGNYFAIREVK